MIIERTQIDETTFHYHARNESHIHSRFVSVQGGKVGECIDDIPTSILVPGRSYRDIVIYWCNRDKKMAYKRFGPANHFQPQVSYDFARLASIFHDSAVVDYVANRISSCGHYLHRETLEPLARYFSLRMPKQLIPYGIPSATPTPSPELVDAVAGLTGGFVQWIDVMSNLYLPAQVGEPPHILADSLWSFRDRSLWGILIEHPGQLSFYNLGWRKEQYPAQRAASTVLAILPDVSLKDVGYVVRVHPLCKTVESARRWMYRLPRNAKWEKEV